MNFKNVRACNGYASVMVLGIVVLIAAVLAASGTIIRWHAHSSKQFIDQTESTQMARKGLAEAIQLLMADGDPDVDWLGEPWSLGFQRDGLIVTIEDEGSKLGINWLDESLWSVLFGNHVSDYGRFSQEFQARKQLWNNIPELVASYPALATYKNDLTTYSPFNLNVISEDLLVRLWQAAGSDDLQAAMIVREMLEYRSVDQFYHVDDLGKILSLRSELREIVYPWATTEGPININTAPDNVLRVLAQASGLDSAFVEQIIYDRQLNPIREIDQLSRLVDNGDRSKFADFVRWLMVRSTFFRITCMVESSGTQINAIVERRWLPETNAWMVTICSWIEGGNCGQATYSDD